MCVEATHTHTSSSSGVAPPVAFSRFALFAVQFGDDYKPGDTRHVIAILFASLTDAVRVKADILPKIRQLAQKT